MISTILLGLGALAAAMATVAHWDEIVSWLKDFIYALKELFKSTLSGVVSAAAVFIKTMTEGIAAVMHKLYYRENGEWIEEVRTRKIPEKALPDWAKAKIGIKEEEITEEMETELEMTI